jgi:hypothetical protein
MYDLIKEKGFFLFKGNPIYVEPVKNPQCVKSKLCIIYDGAFQIVDRFYIWRKDASNNWSVWSMDTLNVSKIEMRYDIASHINQGKLNKLSRSAFIEKYRNVVLRFVCEQDDVMFFAGENVYLTYSFNRESSYGVQPDARIPYTVKDLSSMVAVCSLDENNTTIDCFFDEKK